MSKNIRDRLLLLGLVLASGIGCDQTTKRLAEHTLKDVSHSFLFDTVRLQFIKNSGAFLGFGSHFPEEAKFWLFLIMPVVFLGFLLVFVLYSRRLLLAQRIMITLIISGGLGNLIDRIVLSGHVTDFINLGIGPVRTGIFNIADVAIMAGAFGLLFIEMRRNWTAKQNQAL